MCYFGMNTDECDLTRLVNSVQLIPGVIYAIDTGREVVSGGEAVTAITVITSVLFEIQ